MIQTLLQDLRYGVRMLRKSPGASFVAVAALALGIGANTAIFSVVHAVLLAPLPYFEPDRIVTLLNRGDGPAAPAVFLDWRAQARSFERMGTAEAWSANLTGRERPEQIIGLHLSEDMFPLLGVAPALGRTFLPEDFQKGKDQVLVLSYRLWERRFARDPAILNQKLLLDGSPYTVVGVMPPQFRFAPFWITQAEMWAPQDLANRANDRGAQSLRPFARLKPGVTREQAQAEMDTICSRLAQAYPDTDAGFTVQVQPLRQKVVGNVRPALLIVLGAVGFVLLIACANVANMQLSRALARTREIAIRTALGAGRFQIIRQLLTENVVLSLAGGMLGLILAFWGVDSLRVFIQSGATSFSSRLPGAQEIGLNTPVLMFSLGLSLVTGLFFGVFPALQLSKGGLNDSLKEGGRSLTPGLTGSRLRGILVISEVAIAMVLLIGAGLLVRSFLQLEAIDPGFVADHVQTMTVSVAGNPQYTGERRESLYGQIVDQVKALPGVESASMINHIPIGGDVWGQVISIEGRPLQRPGEGERAVYRVARPDYFRSMKIPLLEGRDFTNRDNAGAPLVVIVNERVAKTFWPNGNAIGQRLTFDDPRRNPHWLTVVGVIRNVKQSSWADPPEHECYVPFLQEKHFLEETHSWVSYMTLVVRTSGDPLHSAKLIQNTVWSIDKNLPLSQVQTMNQIIAQSVWQPRFNLLLVGLFAALALALAATGIYGVMAYSVTERTHEIGIRMALGARQADVLRLVIGEAMALAAIGSVTGLAGAFALTRLLAGLLYQVRTTDPVVFAIAPGVFIAVAFLASYLPARRATRVDPLLALRWE